MPLDSRVLEGFYDSRIGQVTRRLILRRLRAHWPDVSGQRVLGFGYAVPYLRTIATDAERTIAAMPAAQAALPWSNGGRGLTALADELGLPFPDASFDCLLVVHGLEVAEAQRPFLRELWRVLTPAGRLMVVAPNRTSLWAQFENSPFGHGQPYSRGQLQRLLQESLFRPEAWDSALFMPPFGHRRTARSGQVWERIGYRLWPQFAGVHIVEASKSLYASVPVAKGRRAALARALAAGTQARNAHAGSLENTDPGK